MIELKTKLPAESYGKPCGKYTATLSYNTKGKALVSIYPTADTAGKWSYYLESLLGLDTFSSPPCDFLWLDCGQRWGVNNMLELLREIINMEKTT